ncbi:MAG: hypothetical protein ALECFALPRED_002115 [Alectoria fallacina]|uniref:Methyltransferase domain-containing protein n=1 Tax=Alectoria fallacina TaxID=1903189 RepID=A0A8H3IC17_9LECA|nr:MAG: hypothetical protein ALECFALPRED_002115 [Alectoria fallacina]
MIQSPVYEQTLARLLKGEKLLDLACEFGQNMRRLYLEGAESDDLSGFDMISDLIEAGHDLFADRNHTRMTFFTGNLFNQSWNFENLNDKFDIVFASMLFHLFDWDEQVAIAKRVVSFLQKKAGSILFGQQIGHLEPGLYPYERAFRNEGYEHNATTLQQMWDSVGSRHEETGDTEGRDWDMGASKGEAVGAADVGLQNSDFVVFSGNTFEGHNISPFEDGNGSDLPNTEAISFDLPKGPESNLEQDVLDWDPSQDLGQPFSTIADIPLQPQTQPKTPDVLDSGNSTAGSAVTGCSCLPSLYSMLAKFQSLPEPSFPYSMGSLRSAAALSRGVVACQGCLKTYNTALQNSMVLATLLQLLINEYAKLLKHIDERSKQAEKITFRFSDPSSPFDSRHTGRPDCPMAINVDLTGDEWRTLARKAVAQEVLGNSQESSGLFGLVQGMKDRRASWHERISKS